LAEWKDVISLGLNLSTILVGIKVLRYLARVEMKLQLVWADYAQRHGIKLEDK